MSEPLTKTEQLLEHMRGGDWNAALSLASRFKMLGDHIVTIHRAHAARVNPDFYAQMGDDPKELVQKGIDALTQLYGHRLEGAPTTEKDDE